MKTLAFVCLLLGLANLVVALFALGLVHDVRPLIHSTGTTVLAFLIYSTIPGKGEPDEQA